MGFKIGDLLKYGIIGGKAFLAALPGGIIIAIISSLLGGMMITTALTGGTGAMAGIYMALMIVLFVLNFVILGYCANKFWKWD